RVTGMSESRDGYIDRLDFTCQMILEGRPELAGIGDGWGADGSAGLGLDGAPDRVPVGSDADNEFHFPTRFPSLRDNCKIGTFRGVDRQGGRVQLRWVGTENLDITFSADITDDNNDAFGSVMKDGPSELSPLDEGWIMGEIFPEYGLDVDVFTGGTPEPNDGAFWRPPESYSSFETLDDPINNEHYDLGSNVEHWGVGTKIVWDVTDTMALTYIGSLRRMDSLFAARSGVTQGDNTPFDYIHQTLEFVYEQTQHELRMNGLFLNDRLDLTVGAFYWTSDEKWASRATS